MNDNDRKAARDSAQAEGPETAARTGCPTCGKPMELAFRPFCSKRCRDIDLNRWLNGVYAVPGKSTEEEADEDV